MYPLSTFRCSQRLKPVLLAAFVTCISGLTGCEQEPVITRTKVPKPPVVVASDRMLAAIVPAQGRGWFIKLSGDKDAIEKQQPAFTEMLSTLTVSGEKLNWKVPAGWSEKPGNEMRAATLVAGDSKLECAISFLPADDATSSDYLIANINRWRGQIALEPWDDAGLAKAMTPIKVADQDGQFVEMNNDREAILGAVVLVGDQGWFFKLKGDRKLALSEKDNFQNFVKSMKFK